MRSIQVELSCGHTHNIPTPYKKVPTRHITAVVSSLKRNPVECTVCKKSVLAKKWGKAKTVPVVGTALVPVSVQRNDMQDEIKQALQDMLAAIKKGKTLKATSWQVARAMEAMEEDNG